jgi:putative transposase
MEYQRDEHRVHLIVYHLVWTPKRRKPVLTGEIAKDCRSLIEQNAWIKDGTLLNWLSSRTIYIYSFVPFQTRQQVRS